MSFHKMNCLRAKDMVRRKEFFATFVVSLAIFLVPTFIDIFSLLGSDRLSLYPAWFYFGLSGRPSGNYVTRDTIECFQILLVPFICSLAYSYCIFDECSSGTEKFILPRTRRKNYYLSGAFMAFLGAFVVVFVPMIISQLVFSIAVPLNSFKSTASDPFYDNTFIEMEYFKGLALNSPYLYNLLYCFIPALIGGLVGLMSFSISLVYKRNRFLVLTLPGIMWLVSSFIVPLLGHPQWMIGYMIAPPLGLEYMRLSYLVITIVIIFAFDALLLIHKIFLKKDCL